ncbi:Fc.00g022370.m01.CDS01 [Cosmosporella sp. VM-42]
MPNQLSATEKILVIGGVAYAFSYDPDPSKFSVISQWPGAGIDTRPKVPSEFAYEDGKPKQWGYMLRAGTQRYGGFKLLLDPNAGRKAYNDPHLTLSIDPDNPFGSFIYSTGYKWL